jgi:hypothetical protein
MDGQLPPAMTVSADRAALVAITARRTLTGR